MNFDQSPNRALTDAFKWKKYQGRDILPMWVADTEFKCAEPILQALNNALDHGVLGYTLPAQHTGANQAVVHWLEKQHGWQIQAEWIVWMPGVVPAFNVASKALCQPGDKIIAQVPNYPPLLAAAGLHGCERLSVGTVEVDGRWTLDFEALERHAADPKAKLFILCNPMNPVGSVLTQDELNRIADICSKHAVTVCSDEIHCDLILSSGRTHLPAGAHPTLADDSITLMAASKTFNVAGLGTAFAVIPNPRLRRKFTQTAQGMVPWVTVLGLEATQAAFTLCDDWYAALLNYLRANRDYLVGEINSIPGLKALTPEATFLLWIDGSGLGVDNTQVWCEERGVGPSPGADFGAKHYFRLNFGCPRSHLETAIDRLQQNP